MRQKLLPSFSIAALALLATLSANAQSQESRPALEALAPEQQLLVFDWLSRDCSSADRLVLEGLLTAVGQRLEPVFWEAYRLGPPADQLESDANEIRRRFDMRQKWLAEGSADELFGAEEVQRLSSLDVEEYVRGELERIRIGYTTAAVLGLALVATEEGSAAELSVLADDAENPAAVAAGMALEAMAQRQGGD